MLRLAVIMHALALLVCTGVEAQAQTSAAETSGEDEIVDDPTVAYTSAPSEHTPQPSSGPQVWHLSLNTQGAALTSWKPAPGPKDVVEARVGAVLAAGKKENDWLRWELGVRFDALARARHGDAALLTAGAYTCEVRPWEAFLDVGVSDNLRFKVGNQIIAWGKLDLFSAADMLGVQDLRRGLSMEARRVPTPSLTASWYPIESLSIEVGYTPFFSPHRFDLLGTNYALIGPNAPGARASVLRYVQGQISPSQYASLSNVLTTINAPQAQPYNGEVAGRLTAHSSRLDVSVSAGYLRAKLPALVQSPILTQALEGPLTRAKLDALNSALERGEHLFESRYDRYTQVAIDLELPLGPLTFTAEAGYTPSRPLYVYDPAQLYPGSAKTGLSQLGAKLTYINTTETMITAEVSYLQALHTPPAGTSYLGFRVENWLVLGLLAARQTFAAHAFDVFAVASSHGPSLTVVGRYSLELSDLLTVGMSGAFFYGASRYDGSFGSLAHGLDQIALFANWSL